MDVKIEKHNPYWKLYYQKEKARIGRELSNNNLSATIEHIGSTAVVDLAAKPILDIMLGIPVGADLDRTIPIFRELGYIYVSKYNDIMPFRRFFIKLKSRGVLGKKQPKEITKTDEMPSKKKFERLVHIHLVHLDTLFYQKHIAFRNHLQKNKEDRDLYQQLKLHLAGLDWELEADYAQAKSSFISSILTKLGFES